MPMPTAIAARTGGGLILRGVLRGLLALRPAFLDLLPDHGFLLRGEDGGNFLPAFLFVGGALPDLLDLLFLCVGQSEATALVLRPGEGRRQEDRRYKEAEESFHTGIGRRPPGEGYSHPVIL
jgi:hypothetical protein